MYECYRSENSAVYAITLKVLRVPTRGNPLAVKSRTRLVLLDASQPLRSTATPRRYVAGRVPDGTKTADVARFPLSVRGARHSCKPALRPLTLGYMGIPSMCKNPAREQCCLTSIPLILPAALPFSRLSVKEDAPKQMPGSLWSSLRVCRREMQTATERQSLTLSLCGSVIVCLFNWSL